MEPKEFADALLNLSEWLTNFYDFLDGQKEELTRRGYSEEAIEKMILTTHGCLLTKFSMT